MHNALRLGKCLLHHSTLYAAPKFLRMMHFALAMM